MIFDRKKLFLSTFCLSLSLATVPAIAGHKDIDPHGAAAHPTPNPIHSLGDPTGLGESREPVERPSRTAPSESTISAGSGGALFEVSSLLPKVSCDPAKVLPELAKAWGSQDQSTQDVPWPGVLSHWANFEHGIQVTLIHKRSAPRDLIFQLDIRSLCTGELLGTGVTLISLKEDRAQRKAQLAELRRSPLSFTVVVIGERMHLPWDKESRYLSLQALIGHLPAKGDTSIDFQLQAVRVSSVGQSAIPAGVFDHFQLEHLDFSGKGKCETIVNPGNPAVEIQGGGEITNPGGPSAATQRGKDVT